MNLINDKLALKDEYSNFINILRYSVAILAVAEPSRWCREENRVYFMYETELKIFNLTTFDLLDTVQLPNVSGRIDQLVRTGPERLAINTDAGNVYMIDLKPPLPTTPIPAMPRTSELALAIMLIGMRLRLRARERHSGDKQQRTLHRWRQFFESITPPGLCFGRIFYVQLFSAEQAAGNAKPQ